MYSNTLQLNWKVGHGLPLTSVASSLNISSTTANHYKINVLYYQRKLRIKE